MDLSLTDSQEALKKTAQDFIRREAPRDVLLALDETDTGYNPKSWQRAADAGWLAVVVPEEYGGCATNLLEAGLLFEELGKAPLPGPYFTAGVLGAQIIVSAGSEAQKKELLPELVEGRCIPSLALTEQDYGWKPESVNMRAERSGGDFVLQGQKVFVPYGAAATHFICVARTGGKGSAGITTFIVDAKSPGVAVRTLNGFTRWMSEISFEAVRVPRSAVMGEVDGGWQPLQAAIAKSIPVLSAYMVGGCQTAFDMALSHSQTRIQFGQPVGRFQFVQENVIYIVNQLDAARLAAYEALWKLDAGRPATTSVHMAKALCSEAYYQACNASHKVHGGLGYAKDYGLTLHTSMSRALYDYLGNPAHHRRLLTAQLLS